MDKEYKILIIGAGLSGLTLAYELTKISIPFKIIEARNRIGGRIHTIRNSANDTIEMGATWFSNQHINLKKLALELDVKYEKQYTGEKVLYDYYNGKRTIQEIQLPPQNENSFIFSNGTIDLVNHLLNKIAPNIISFEEVVTSLEFIDELWHIKTNLNQRSLSILFRITCF